MIHIHLWVITLVLTVYVFGHLQCLLVKETHKNRFVLEIMFVLVIATIMIEIIAEKEFEACLLVRGKIIHFTIENI